MQLLGDTHANLMVNGKGVGEVFARRSLSLTVERERVKVFDIAGNLRTGLNSFVIEARNYQPNGSAGLNVYALITLANGDTVRVLSDSTWSVQPLSEDPGPSPELPGARWRPAAEFHYPWPVIEPDFGRQRYSWIER
jgi:hypothetical protein